MNSLYLQYVSTCFGALPMSQIWAFVLTPEGEFHACNNDG